MTRTVSALLAVTVLAAASAAYAQEAKPSQVGTFKDWSTWSFQQAAGGKGPAKVCYIYAEPAKMQPNGLDHGKVSFSITTNPGAGIVNEANFVVGYPFKEQSSVVVDIDGKKFNMFTQGDSAWLLDKDDEPALLAAMKKGKSMVVSGQSRRGNKTTYNYSLNGVSAAADKMIAECK